MDKGKIGVFLCNLRKEKKMTQENVASLLFTSRENISKWERGVNMPTPDMLLELSKLYGVSVNEILFGERENKKNHEKIDNISVELLKDSNAKIKRITKYFITVIAVVVISFLIYYFVNTYNTIHVFLVSGVSDNFSTIDGVAIFSKDKSYIKLGNIDSNNKDIKSIEFLYFDKYEKEHMLIISNKLDYVLTSTNGDNQSFSYSNMNYIKNNSFLRIKYNNTEELIKIIFNEDMSNSSLFKDGSGNNIEIDQNALNNDNNIATIENYFKSNFKYDKDSRQYYKEVKNHDKNVNMYYSIDTYTISIFEDYDDGVCKSYIYSIINNEFEYLNELSGEVINNFVYDILNNQCIDGNCDKTIIEYFNQNYLKNMLVSCMK